jgi:DNA-binding response OmpR family regulator
MAEGTPSGARRKTRALIVDGDERTLVLATEALTSFGPGFDVATARSLDEARVWVHTFDPELVLLDEAFADLALDLRRTQMDRPLKVVLVTSSTEEPHDGHPYFEVLAKPVTLSSLLRVARRTQLH